MSVNIHICTEANCTCFSAQWSQPMSEVVVAASEGLNSFADYQGTTGQWETTYSAVPFGMAPEVPSMEIGGTTYYAAATSQNAPGTSTGEENIDFSEEGWNMEMWQQTTYYPVEQNAPNAIQIGGTTYYQQTSDSSGYNSSEEASSPPVELHDEWTWMNELPIINDTSILRQILESLILNNDEMESAGYPVIDNNGQLKIQPTIYERDTKMWIEENEPLRKCSRCRVAFPIGADGRFPTGPGICQYRAKGQEKEADHHITSQRFVSELEKFVATPAPTGDEDERSKQVFALDCEMVITTGGPALARLSVVNFDGEMQLDVVVRPEAEVVDCLTEFSGITMEMLGKATHNLEECQRLLFQLVNSDSILIGHGLGSDLKALRLIHRNVIDTSIMYQDAGGKKIALRVLAMEHLGRTIQADNATTFGHCSEEDALASLDLVKCRIGYC